MFFSFLPRLAKIVVWWKIHIKSEFTIFIITKSLYDVTSYGYNEGNPLIGRFCYPKVYRGTIIRIFFKKQETSFYFLATKKYKKFYSRWLTFHIYIFLLNDLKIWQFRNINKFWRKFGEEVKKDSKYKHFIFKYGLMSNTVLANKLTPLTASPTSFYCF